MKISVIVPVYNVERYLPDCVDSLLAQDHTDYEIILVDDGSTDGSGALCDRYAEKDSRVHVIHQENGGLSSARNTGIEHASGEYITFVDSDDYVASDILGYLYRNLRHFDADISVCQYWLTYPDKTIDPHNCSIHSDHCVEGNSECVRYYFTHGTNVQSMACAKLYKASLFREIRFPHGKIHEDEFTTYRLIAQCSKLAIGKERKYYYRMRDGSLTNSKFSPKHLDAVEAAFLKKKFIDENYPELKLKMGAEVVHAVNQCAMKMINSGSLSKGFIPQMQQNYRRYEGEFLCGRNSWKAKLFSVAAYINLHLLIRACIFLKIKL